VATVGRRVGVKAGACGVYRVLCFRAGCCAWYVGGVRVVHRGLTSGGVIVPQKLCVFGGPRCGDVRVASASVWFVWCAGGAPRVVGVALGACCRWCCGA